MTKLGSIPSQESSNIKDIEIANDLDTLQSKLGISFHNQLLLKQAFIHSSYINELPGLSLESNERLEFLGDSMIDIAISQEIYILFPDKQEGELTNFRSALVRGETLAQVAKTLSLGEYLILGSGEEASGGRERRTNLAAVFEALVGAILLDKGQRMAKKFTLNCLYPEIRRLAQDGVPNDPKSHLQEKSQSLGKGTPIYRTGKLKKGTQEGGFKSEVIISEEVMGTGEGKRKVDAERAAALKALDSL